MTHWTEETSESFVYSLVANFRRQIEVMCPSIKQKDLADLLDVSPSMVSQYLHGDGTLSLHSMVKIARVLGKKVAVIVYDDSDHMNEAGPIAPDVFVRCWNRAGQPTDMFEAEDEAATERS